MSRNTYTQESDNNRLSTIDNDTILLIVYKTNRLGSDEDFEKRWKVQGLTDKVLKVTGTGQCDGGCMNINSMEICCHVNDFDKAKKVLSASLASTPYSDYVEIVEENERYVARVQAEQRRSPRLKITDEEITRAFLREARKQHELKR